MAGPVLEAEMYAGNYPQRQAVLRQMAAYLQAMQAAQQEREATQRAQAVAGGAAQQMLSGMTPIAGMAQPPGPQPMPPGGASQPQAPQIPAGMIPPPQRAPFAANAPSFGTLGGALPGRPPMPMPMGQGGQPPPPAPAPQAPPGLRAQPGGPLAATMGTDTKMPAIEPGKMPTIWDMAKNIRDLNPNISGRDFYMALEAAQPMLEAAYRQETMQLRDQMNVLRERDAENRTMLTALRDAERQRHEGVMEEQGQQRLAGMEERIRQSQERIDKKAGGGAGGGAALPGGVGTHLLQHESGTFAFNERSGKAWKFNDETQKYEPISPNQIPKDARKFGASLSLASAQRMNLVKAGASNAIRMLDEIQKNYGDASTTSVFFGQSAENPLTRGLYGAGRGQMSAKQQKVDAAWAGFIDEAIPVFTGGLRGSDAFRRFLIEQAPAPGDKPATVKEKMRIIRNNIQGTNKAFFNKFVSDSKMWAEGTKPEEIEQAREAMKDRGEATEPSIDDLVKKYGQ